MVSPKADYSTIDLTCSRIRLRGDLVFQPQPTRSQVYYHLEVPGEARYFRIGYAEYCFISLLDGQTTFGQALTITAQQLGPSALEQNQALTVVSWLLENKLADLPDHGSPQGKSTGTTRRAAAAEPFNPLWFKFKLCNPDRFLARTVPWLSHCFRWPAIVGSLLLISAALIVLSMHWKRFTADAETILAPDNWLWMLFAWLILKLLHESAHACTCRHYGGEVREVGITFALLTPMPHVDVTSCWRLPSKWNRIHVALAGVHVELVAASLAAIAWAFVESPLTAHLMHNIIVMASVSAIVFNLNPLMRFDGYYVLADLLEIPNLYSESSLWMREWAARMFFGDLSRTGEKVGWQRAFIAIYGIAASGWRLVVWVGMLLFATALAHGAGVVLALLGLAGWVRRPAQRLYQELRRRLREAPRTVCRAGLLAVAGLVLIVVLSRALPNPAMVTASGIVDYQDLAVVRALVPGFVDVLQVNDGDIVAADDVLLVMRNDQLQMEFDELTYSVEQSDIRLRQALDLHQAATAQIEYQNGEALRKQLAEKRRRVEALTIRAPAAGRVVARRLRELQQSYVAEGTELLSLGVDIRKEVVLAVGHDAIDESFAQIGSDVQVRIGSRRLLQGKLKRVEPRASTRLPSPALAASEGGALPVKEAAEKTASKQNELVLVDPHFRAVVSLDSSIAEQLYCGERGYAIIGPRQESLGTYCVSVLRDWLRRKWTQAEQSAGA
jgi:putative peptide zinc metalloprotease protein